MLCKLNPEIGCRYEQCEYYDFEINDCAYRDGLPLPEFIREDLPAWMGQLPFPLKYDRRLAKFPTLGELADEYLKISEG